ncbi:NUDIX hydrolase [Aquabacterium sp.]|uniref:NUDIX hydrolase n=1 Tax=Aquabacterium sp. TaxID=1872578 RepID=UPI0037851DB0
MNPQPPFPRDAGFEAHLRQRLADWPLQTASHEGLRRAAVAMVITDAAHGGDLPGLARHAQWRSEAALIVTRRAAGLRAHAGQFALPGGRVEEGESLEAAALRELHEEVGLVLDASAIIGRLDDYVSRSGYAITPIVVWGGAAEALAPNPDEVASIHRIPLTELLRPDAPILTDEGGTQLTLRMPVGEGWIAAPTAALLYQFREVCLLGRDTRVAHFEQPRFAWQ